MRSVGDGSPWFHRQRRVPRGTAGVGRDRGGDAGPAGRDPHPAAVGQAEALEVVGVGPQRRRAGQAGDRAGLLGERALVVELADGDEPQRVGVGGRGLDRVVEPGEGQDGRAAAPRPPGPRRRHRRTPSSASSSAASVADAASALASAASASWAAVAPRTSAAWARDEADAASAWASASSVPSPVTSPGGPGGVSGSWTSSGSPEVTWTSDGRRGDRSQAGQRHDHAVGRARRRESGRGEPVVGGRQALDLVPDRRRPTRSRGRRRAGTASSAAIIQSARAVPGGVTLRLSVADPALDVRRGALDLGVAGGRRARRRPGRRTR